MGHQLVSDNINIDLCPRIDQAHKAEAGMQITIGDLHGNAVKLLYFLVRHGVLEMSAENYAQIVEIYRIPVENLTKDNLLSFNTIINNAKIIDAAKASNICLIGDELADRGMNDFYTLKLLEKLNKNQIPLEIIISNHGAEFLNPYEKKNKFNVSMLRDQAQSSINLQKIIDNNLVTKEEITTIVEACYKPNLKAIGYSLNEEQDKITIYSHAAIGIDNIKYIAEKLGVPYNNDSTTSLANTIEAVNKVFTLDYINQSKVYSLLNLNKVPRAALNGTAPIDPEKFPFAHLIWNRNATGLTRPYTIDFVHGHDKSDKTQNNIYNLDNDLGKNPLHHAYSLALPESRH